MLVEIDCDKFYRDGSRMLPFRFTEGLNTVMGAENTANSIGKSTMLLIIDFCFGGSDYPRKARDVIKHIGNHEICFAFRLGGEVFHYKRATDDLKTVIVCDDNYNQIRTMRLEDFTTFLGEQYGLGESGVTFRQAISNFFRIWQRNNVDVDRPLRAHSNDTLIQGVERLLGLFGQLNPLRNVIDAAKEAKRQLDLFGAAGLYYDLPRAENISTVNENKIKIENLEKQRDLAGSKAGLTASEYTPAQQAAIEDVQSRRQPLQQKLTRVKRQLAAIERDKDLNPNATITNKFDPLLEFFPEVDIEKLANVEKFHESLKRILRKEYARETEQLLSEENRLSIALEELDKKLLELHVAPTVKTAEIRSYVELNTQINRLKGANSAYKEHQELLKKKRAAEDAVKTASVDLIKDVEERLNQAMERIDREITDEQRTAPQIQLESTEKYIYSIEDDKGTGSTQRGLISFDLALLEQSLLPAVAHDTMLVQPIEDQSFDGIVQVYARQKKQVFLAIDKISRYSAETQEILKRTTFVHLEPGRELFGRSWSKKKGNSNE